MQICLANLHFFLPLTTFRAKKIQKIFWFFARLFVPLHPLNQNTNKIMDDYPAENYNS